jgi:hypothetical protein
LATIEVAGKKINKIMGFGPWEWRGPKPIYLFIYFPAMDHPLGQNEGGHGNHPSSSSFFSFFFLKKN